MKHQFFRSATAAKNVVVTAPLVTVGAGASVIGAALFIAAFWRWRRRGKALLDAP